MPGGQLPDRFQLLGVAQLGLQVLDLGDVRPIAMHHLARRRWGRTTRSESVPVELDLLHEAASGRSPGIRGPSSSASGRQDSEHILFQAEGPGHLLGGIVGIGQRAIPGKFQHRIRAELAERPPASGSGPRHSFGRVMSVSVPEMPPTPPVLARASAGRRPPPTAVCRLAGEEPGLVSAELQAACRAASGTPAGLLAVFLARCIRGKRSPASP